jgi:ABC-type antimicrobial peptide transport system permease subunit
MAFQEVENSYIRIFNLLGGLGVLIGSAGFGLVTARNLRERRHEFAIFHAIGLPGRITREVVMMEARQNIRWGLGIGSVAALLAILPSLVEGDAGMRAFGWIALWIAMIAANAWFFSWLAFHRQIRSATDAGRESGSF